MSVRTQPVARRRLNYTAEQCLEALAIRHAADVFVPECKSGPTWGGTPFRLDAWAMPRSWAHLAFWGYEIKVSRSDFTGDTKWHNYLPLCHRFAFVCPWGLIQPDEVGESAGLVWVARTRCVTKKQPPLREIEAPTDLLVYVLMSRAHIDATEIQKNNGTPNREGWRKWLAQRGEDRELGYLVSRGVRERYAKMECETIEAKKRGEWAQTVLDAAKACGIDEWDCRRFDTAKRAIQEALAGADLVRSLERAATDLADVQRKVAAMIPALAESPP